MHQKRLEWYSIRLNMCDGSVIPFAYLHHAQTKVLAEEVTKQEAPRHRRLSCLFSRMSA